MTIRTPHRRFMRSGGITKIKIQGNVLPITYARIVYRCEECFGDLAQRNFGLVCKAAPDEHRGFIHNKLAAEIGAKQAELLAQAQEDFEILDGKITPRKDMIDAIEGP